MRQYEKKYNIIENFKSCPKLEDVDLVGWIMFGIFIPLFLWLILFKLNAGLTILKLPFNYQMGGIKNMYSSQFLNIGE